MQKTLTYEQIEKEFEELFVKKVMLIDEPDKLAYEEMKYPIEPDAIKSFLKQSFIKYLKDEVERLEKIKIKPFTSRTGSDILQMQKYNPVVRTDIGVVGFNEAISDQIKNLQAQIKELEK